VSPPGIGLGHDIDIKARACCTGFAEAPTPTTEASTAISITTLNSLRTDPTFHTLPDTSLIEHPYSNLGSGLLLHPKGYLQEEYVQAAPPCMMLIRTPIVKGLYSFI